MKSERAACQHCGLPVAARARAPFCCSGCFVAFRLTGEEDAGTSDRLGARVGLSGVLATGVMVFSLAQYGEFLAPTPEALEGETAAALAGLQRLAALALTVPVVWLLGVPLAEAVVRMRRPLSADALVLSGTLAAFSVSVWKTFAGGGAVYYETTAMVLVLFGLGRWLDVRARERAQREIHELAQSAAPAAVRIQGAEEQRVALDELRPDDLVRFRPGEEACVDGEVVAGRSFVDKSDLTGEEEPAALAVGDEILAGSRLIDGALDVRVRRTRGDRAVDAVERLLSEADGGRATLVRMADRLSGFLMPVAFVIAVVAGFAHGRTDGLEAGWFVGLSVVLIACPCALGLATPLAFWFALGRAWRFGALVRGGDVLERLARVRRVYVDKTGTLTTGEFELTDVEPTAESGLSREEVLAIAAALEAGSEHPIGRALRAACPLTVERPAVSDFRALVGIGVQGCIEGERWELRRDEAAQGGRTGIVLRRADRTVARLELRGELRPEAAAALAELTELGLEPTVLTGDGPGPARELASKVGVEVRCELLPGDKVAAMGEAALAVQDSGAPGIRGVMFVGDGVNDAPALAAADVGVAMVGANERATHEADVRLVQTDLSMVPELVRLARSAVNTARWNLVWAFGYNAIGVALAAAGRLTPVFAAFAMVGSSLLVVLHSTRASAQVSSSPEQPRGELESMNGAEAAATAAS